MLTPQAPQAFADPKYCYSFIERYNVGYGHGYSDEFIYRLKNQ